MTPGGLAVFARGWRALAARVRSWLLRVPGGALVLFRVRDEDGDVYVDVETVALVPGEPVVRIGYRLFRPKGRESGEELWFAEVELAGVGPFKGKLLDVTVEHGVSADEILDSIERLLREAEVVAERGAWLPDDGE